jgi:hypothetical protein
MAYNDASCGELSRVPDRDPVYFVDTTFDVFAVSKLSRHSLEFLVTNPTAT